MGKCDVFFFTGLALLALCKWFVFEFRYTGTQLELKLRSLIETNVVLSQKREE